MKEMSPEASELVNAGRQAFRPTEADRARLMAAVTGAATLSAGMTRRAGTQPSFKRIVRATYAAGLLAVALPAAAAGVYWLHEPAEEVVQPALTVHQPPAVVAPSSAKPTLRVAPPPLEPQIAPSEPSAPLSPERSGGAVGESPKPANEISTEVALLSKAQAALSRGRPQEALAAIAEHARRFPRGVLAEERAATRARTLCALGRTQEAASDLKRIEKLNPTSPYLARARESCGLF
jgi:hypothetical protein